MQTSKTNKIESFAETDFTESITDANCSLSKPKEYLLIPEANASSYNSTKCSQNNKNARKQAKYNALHREKIKQKQAIYDAQHKEQILQKQATYDARHKERIIEKQARYNAVNKELIKQKQARYNVCKKIN